MNIIAIVSTALVIVTCIVWYLLWRQTRPRHIFLAYDFATSTVQPFVRRTLTGTIKVPGPEGKKVPFAPVQGMEMHRRDGKGLVLMGDLATGRLFRPNLPNATEGIHPIFHELALADGRVQQIAAAARGDGLTLKHVLIGLAIVGGLVVVVIYQFAKAGGF